MQADYYELFPSEYEWETSTKHHRYVLTLPLNYDRIRLPGYFAWIARLQDPNTLKAQGQFIVGANTRDAEGTYYCCTLGALVLAQGRAIRIEGTTAAGGRPEYRDDNGSDFYADSSMAELSDFNPAYRVLGPCGVFPKGVVVTEISKREGAKVQTFHSFTALNDRTELSLGRIAEIVKRVYRA